MQTEWLTLVEGLYQNFKLSSQYSMREDDIGPRAIHVHARVVPGITDPEPTTTTLHRS